MRSLASGNKQLVKVCNICSLQGHALDMCPTMQEDYSEQANAVDGAFNGQPQHKYDPFFHTNNPGWRDHPDSSIPIDFSPNIIIKQDSPLHSQTPMLWGCHPVMIFVRK